MRHKNLPERSFWRITVVPNDNADLDYIAGRIAKVAGVDTVMIEERRVTGLWQEDDNGGGGSGGSMEAT